MKLLSELQNEHQFGLLGPPETKSCFAKNAYMPIHYGARNQIDVERGYPSRYTHRNQSSNTDAPKWSIKSWFKKMKQKMKFPFKNFFFRKECVVCLKKMNWFTKNTNLDCNHKFHTKCILEWYKRKRDQSSCPLCRDTGFFNEETIIDPKKQTRIVKELSEENDIRCRFCSGNHSSMKCTNKDLMRDTESSLNEKYSWTK